MRHQVPQSKRLQAIVVTLLAAAFLPIASDAQRGDARDRPGVVQREVWRDINPPPAPVLSPEEALETFDIEPGFRLELVASEPLINDPVAIAWDEDGRLWATEFWSYMPDIDGTGEDQPNSRVVVLEDLDQDGVMDKSTVFLDGLVLPRAIAIVDGGVLIADPPNLLFCEDLDGDLISDRETKLIEYAATGNPEHAENGLMRGIDNWLYNAKSNRRFKFDDGRILEDKTRSRGQWGIAQDDFGRLYYNHNSFMLYADAVPFDSIDRHPGWEPKAGFSHEVVRDPWIYPARVNPGINRAYNEGWLAPDHRMKRADAASAPAIFRGNRYPEAYHGDAFVPDPAGNMVAAYQLHDDGMEVYGVQRLHHSPKWGSVSFLASSDERFRPVSVATGPDGFLYIVDMYRGIIQHKTFVTTFLRKQIIERGLDNPVGLGRIYRLVHESDSDSRAVPELSKATDRELVEYLASANGWQRDTSQRLLVGRAPLAPATIDALRTLARDGNELARIHSIWTLHGTQTLDPDTISASLENDATPWTQAHIWRAAASLIAELPPSHKLAVAYRSALRSPHQRVRLHALHALPLALGPEDLARQFLELDAELFNNPYYIDAAVSALYGHEIAFLEALQTRSIAESEGLTQLVSALANATFDANTHDNILSSTASTSAGWPMAIFKDQLAERTANEKGRAFAKYSQSEIESIEKGRTLYNTLCAVCHQDDGQGIANLAPPLAGSHWVTGAKDRLIRIVSQGLEGPIQVKGQEWDLLMPAHGAHPQLQGDNMADLLSYIRAAWGNQADTVTTSEIDAALAPHSDRATPWTAKELEAQE